MLSGPTPPAPLLEQSLPELHIQDIFLRFSEQGEGSFRYECSMRSIVVCVGNLRKEDILFIVTNVQPPGFILIFLNSVIVLMTLTAFCR